jgi:leucyl-tRNA synthetase
MAKILGRKSNFAAKQVEKPKYYVLDMFPYPSGQDCVGIHWVTLPLMCIQDTKDIKVLMFAPMGYDSFGLPAEQYYSNNVGRYDFSKY